MVWIREGRVLHAIVLTQQDHRPVAAGEQALFHILDWAEGQFRFLSAADNEVYLVTIRRPTAALIVEALRYRSSQPARPLPLKLMARTPLRRLPQLVGTDETNVLSWPEWLVLTSIERMTTAAEVSAQTGLCMQQVLACVTRLIDLGLAAAVPLADLPARRLTIELLPPSSPPSGDQRATQDGISKLTRAIRRRLSQLSVMSA